MKKLLLATTLLLGVIEANADTFGTVATHAYLMDAGTGTVLFQKAAEEKMYPASMSKLMTAYLLFEALKKGQYTLDTEFIVSDNAWRKGGAKTGGSTMFLTPKQSVKIRDLLRGIIVQSGNDACIVVAEGMAGSEETFAQMMSVKAKQLGLQNSSFRNATGLPNPDHVMTAKDLALLAQHIINDFPEYYPIYSEKEFTYNNIKQENRNPLLGQIPGADGLKTGHTSEAGYGLTGSVKTNDGHRLIMVISGLKSNAERSKEAKKMITWGMTNFENVPLLTPDQSITKIPVWLGDKVTVDAVPEKELIYTMNKWEDIPIKSVVRFKSPISAPVRKGQLLGEIVTTLPDNTIIKTNLVAKEDVSKLGYFSKIKTLLLGAETE